MKIKTHLPIKELLAQLPKGTITYIDLRCLSALNECIKALRTEHEGQEAPSLFTSDVRHALAVELTATLAQIIKARIPTNARGTPNKRIGLEQEWEEKRAAKAQADAQRKELQGIKRAALEMREALEVFEKRAIFAAGCEVVGMPPDNEARNRNLTPALDPVEAALSTLFDTPTSHDHLRAQVEAMQDNFDALTRAVSVWCNAQNVRAEGKAGGVHKGKALAAWLEACKKLGRDIAEELRNLK